MITALPSSAVVDSRRVEQQMQKVLQDSRIAARRGDFSRLAQLTVEASRLNSIRLAHEHQTEPEIEAAVSAFSALSAKN